MWKTIKYRITPFTTGWPNLLPSCYSSPIVSELPDLKDCPKCGSEIKISERPFSLPFAVAKDNDLKPSGDGIALYPYICLKCWCVELYTSRKDSAVKLREARAGWRRRRY